MMQTPTFDPTSAKEPELRRWLAELPCPEAEAEAGYNAQALYPSPTRHKNCNVCQDTGVAFPWASEPCGYANATQHFVQGSGLTMEALKRQEAVHASGEWPDKCNSFGRVPNDVGLSDIVWLMMSEGTDGEAWVTFRDTGREDRLELSCEWYKGRATSIWGFGETPTLAALRAWAANEASAT